MSKQTIADIRDCLTGIIATAGAELKATHRNTFAQMRTWAEVRDQAEMALGRLGDAVTTEMTWEEQRSIVSILLDDLQGNEKRGVEVGRADRAPEPGAAGHQYETATGENGIEIAGCTCGWTEVQRNWAVDTPVLFAAWERHRALAEARAEQPPAGDAAGLAFKLGDFLGRWKRLPDEPNRTQLSYALEREALSWLRRNGAVIADVLAAYRAAPREAPPATNALPPIRMDLEGLLTEYEAEPEGPYFGAKDRAIGTLLRALVFEVTALVDRVGVASEAGRGAP